MEEQIISLAKEKGYTISTAESCTGGLLCGTLINVSGASDCIKLGFITYANEAKRDVLGVPSDILDRCGAVSAECASAMAKGAAEKAGADIAVSTTGIAGPDGGTPEKPVGLVYIGICANGNTYAEKFLFKGDRRTIRESAVSKALQLLLNELL